MKKLCLVLTFLFISANAFSENGPWKIWDSKKVGDQTLTIYTQDRDYGVGFKIENLTQYNQNIEFTAEITYKTGKTYTGKTTTLCKPWKTCTTALDPNTDNYSKTTKWTGSFRIVP